MRVDDERPASLWKLCAPLLNVLLATGVAIGLFQLSIWAIVRAGLDRGWVLAAGLVFGFTILGIILVGARLAQKAGHSQPSPALRRHNRDMMIAMSFYVVGLMVAIWGFKELSPVGPLAYLLALAPSLPVVAVVALMARYLRDETDEFQRVMMLHSALVATFLTLVIATVWGFLEMFKLVPHVAGWAAFPIWSLGLGLGRAALARRYR